MSGKQNKIAVLYHGPACSDGFGAAWAAWTVLSENADYIPVNYGDPLPDLKSYEVLYIVDFSYPAATLLELAQTREVVVLDHHKTAKEALSNLTLPNNGLVKFDMTKSGAILAWEYFHPTESIQLMLKYVQDRDLWQWQLSWSKEISAALDLEERSFEAWSRFNADLLDDDGFNAIVNQGSVIVKYIKQKVEITCKKARLERIGDYSVPTVNSAIWQSEIGERLCELNPQAEFSAVFYIDRDGKSKYSLRSRNGFDVSAVAKKYPGGGGHASAAGFTMTE